MPGIQILAKDCSCSQSSATSAGSSSCHCSVHIHNSTVVVPPTPYCHDVSILLNHLNALAFPSVHYIGHPHPPLTSFPIVDKALPLSYAFNPRLIRDELHHPLLCYLAEGVHPALFTDAGASGAKIAGARQLIAVDRIDGYQALQCVLYGTLLLSINSALLEDVPRNKCLDGQRLWTVASSRCAANGASLELRIGGSATVALEIHPTTVVSDELMEAVLAAVMMGAAWDGDRGRVICEKSTDSNLHYDALALLAQVWTRFARDTYTRADSQIRYVVLGNIERSIVFHRKTGEIAVSNLINRDGKCTPRDSVQNLYSLLLALSVLEKFQYDSPALVDLL